MISRKRKKSLLSIAIDETRERAEHPEVAVAWARKQVERRQRRQLIIAALCAAAGIAAVCAALLTLI